MPALMAGAGSILDHSAVKGFAGAATSLRLLGVSVGSEIHLRQAVRDALIWEDEHCDDADYEEPPYEIDGLSSQFRFRQREGSDSSMLVRMCAILEKRVSSIDPIEREIY